MSNLHHIPISLQNQVEHKRYERDLMNAQTGTKTIYFDNNDLMYTEEEVLSGSVNSSQSLTKLKVRVPDQERQRLL